MTAALRMLALTVLLALALPGLARAGGGDYVFEGGTMRQQNQVRRALEASRFDWNRVPARVTIHVHPGTDSFALPGEIWIDADLLNAGRFAWGTVQHEYAHQVDYFALDDPTRVFLTPILGAGDWCYGVSGLDHADYGCERFASLLTWSYWPSKDNTERPRSRTDEAAAMAPSRFRALMARVLGQPDPFSR